MAGVTPHGIRYPDGASKAKNLGPELKNMAEDIDGHIDDRTSPAHYRPIVTGIAEEVVPPMVEEALDDAGVVTAYPEPTVTRTGIPFVPMSWDFKSLEAAYETTYLHTYRGEWTSGGPRQANVPLLTTFDTIREDQIPGTIPRFSDLPDVPDVELDDRIVSLDLPILVARLAVAKSKNDPLAIVFAGSSTTAATPGFVTPLGKMLQETWRSRAPSSVQTSTTADFTARTTPGVHIYNAAQSGTTATNFLDDAESDRIAALNPALVAIMVGSNDWRVAVSAEVYRTNLTNRLNYLDSVIPGPCQFVLVQQYERRDGTVGSEPWSAYETVLREIADARGNTAFLDISAAYYAAGTPLPDQLGLISGDNIHQTAAGYAFMAAYFSGFYFA